MQKQFIQQFKDSGNNFFAKNIKELGPNFLDNIKFRPEVIQRSAVQVFRQIAKGQIDLSKYTEQLRDSRFLDNAIIAASAKYNLFNVSLRGVGILREQNEKNNFDDPYVVAVYDHYAKSLAAYDIILKALNNFKATYDMMCLVSMMKELKDRRLQYNI